MIYHWARKKWVLLPVEENIEQIDLYNEDHDYNTFYF